MGERGQQRAPLRLGPGVARLVGADTGTAGAIAPHGRAIHGTVSQLVLSHFEFEGFRTVMPALRLRSGQAPAGIQGEQAAACGYSAWIPAFAGMTQPSSTPHNHHDRLLGNSAARSAKRKGLALPVRVLPAVERGERVRASCLLLYLQRV